MWKQYYFRHEEIVSVRLDFLPKQKKLRIVEFGFTCFGQIHTASSLKLWLRTLASWDARVMFSHHHF